MPFTKKENEFLVKNGYEELPSASCYAKPNNNISIHKSEKGEFYIYITKERYIRGNHYGASSGVSVCYFKTIPDIFKILDALSGFAIS